MIKINCEEKFIEKNIKDLFKQKKIFTADHQSRNYLNINISLHNESLISELNNDRFIIKTPFQIINYFALLFEKISSFCLEMNGIKYFPFQQCIEKNNKKTKLGETHHKIFYYLVTTDDGIDKKLLYSLIWPNEKAIQLNKLDTHLTNLKKFLKEQIDYDVIFSSNKGIIKIKS
jgi:hypothetical protein